MGSFSTSAWRTSRRTATQLSPRPDEGCRRRQLSAELSHPHWIGGRAASATRALAVIAKARELRPDKPLTQVVNSHHHFDHSGGLRAAIAEGLTVVTHQGNVALYEEIAKRPHTIVPDALANSPKPLMVDAVSDEKVITDGTMTVNLYPVSGPHSETMLIAYFPRERLLVEADVYNPGAAVQAFTPTFVPELKKRNLRIDRVVPLHGKVVPYAQFVKEAAPTVTTN